MTTAAAKRYDTLKTRATKGRDATAALAWLDARYTGGTRAAFKHQMDCTPDEAQAEMRLRNDLAAGRA